MRCLRLMKSSMTLLNVLMLVSFSGCQAQGTDKDLTIVNTDEAQRMITGEKSLLGLGKTKAGAWVDARSLEDYRAGHIPGAISMPYERLNDEHKSLNDYQILIVYGNEYDDDRAKAMSKSLKTLGHDDVRTLNGGMRAWKAAGNPVETGDPKPQTPKR